MLFRSLILCFPVTIGKEANAQKAVAEWNSAVIQAEIDAATKAEKAQIIVEQLANMRKEGALMVANKELSEKQKEKVEKEINYMFYELYTKNQSGGSSTPTTSVRAAIKANRGAK